MVPLLIEEADEIDFTVTKSPSEALFLERNLIRSISPSIILG